MLEQSQQAGSGPAQHPQTVTKINAIRQLINPEKERRQAILQQP
jgi:hypothetical protein